MSDRNYTIEQPEKRNKATIYHVNLTEPWHKRPEFVNLVVQVDSEKVVKDAKIPYPLCNPTELVFWDIVNSSELEIRVTESRIGNFRKVIEKHDKVLSSDPGGALLVEMVIDLTDETPIRAKPYKMKFCWMNLDSCQIWE